MKLIYLFIITLISVSALAKSKKQFLNLSGKLPAGYKVSARILYESSRKICRTISISESGEVDFESRIKDKDFKGEVSNGKYVINIPIKSDQSGFCKYDFMSLGVRFLPPKSVSPEGYYFSASFSDNRGGVWPEMKNLVNLDCQITSFDQRIQCRAKPSDSYLNWEDFNLNFKSFQTKNIEINFNF